MEFLANGYLPRVPRQSFPSEIHIVEVPGIELVSVARHADP